MKGDERLPLVLGSGAEPRRSLLNPIYLLVCELAAARRLTAPPLSQERQPGVKP